MKGPLRYHIPNAWVLINNSRFLLLGNPYNSSKCVCHFKRLVRLGIEHIDLIVCFRSKPCIVGVGNSFLASSGVSGSIGQKPRRGRRGVGRNVQNRVETLSEKSKNRERSTSEIQDTRRIYRITAWRIVDLNLLEWRDSENLARRSRAFEPLLRSYSWRTGSYDPRNLPRAILTIG